MSEKKQTGFLGINEKIAEGIKKGANDSAVDRVVEKRVLAEVTRRADLLEKALDKYNVTKKELDKCKPDIVSYNVVSDTDGSGTGTPLKNEAWSEAKLKAKQNLQKTIADLDIAIMKAMSENDYSKLQQLAGGGNPKVKSEDESAE
jgi:hypothetical protein